MKIYNLKASLILASASPRRKELLKDCGFDFSVHVSEVDESILHDETPDKLVLRLSEAKARAVAQKFNSDFVLGADTDVALGAEIFGKPRNQDDAIKMMQRLSGKIHQVYGAVAIINPLDGQVYSDLSVTRVKFRELDRQEIFAYTSTPEPYDKAGGYAAQGLGASFIEKIEGSYSNVVGLDLALTVKVMRRAKLLADVI
jgi:septum formation protein